jgi:hypothetical protein
VIARRVLLALAVAAQAYLIADALSGGRLQTRTEEAVRAAYGRLRRRIELEQEIARGVGPVLWEAMEALDDGN